ncbi:MAG TPA: hypothetical protein VGM27_22950 [Acidobacteriaceae bacterium]|jgi:hypothetical protein
MHSDSELGSAQTQAGDSVESPVLQDRAFRLLVRHCAIGVLGPPARGA